MVGYLYKYTLINQVIATLKEWYRDFRRKPKWDQFSIIFTVVIGIGSLFFVSYRVFNLYFKNTIENPTFNVNNSSNFGIFYKSPNSALTITPITETRILNENCDSSIYKNTLKFNIEKFFESGRMEGCSFDQTDLKYDIFNAELILPTNQRLFMAKVLANQSYIIAYLNEDYSAACIVPKYKIDNNFDEKKACFIFTFNENPCSGGFNLKPGPAFFSNRTSCFVKISGNYGFLENWNPKI